MSAMVLGLAARLLYEGTPLAMATVIDAEGSVPGKRGTKMLVLEDGTTHGTIGGAGLEERVKAMAREVLESHNPRTERLILSKWQQGGLDSLCGGSVTVLIEYLRPPPRLLFIGGGHVARAIADQCDLLGIGYVVVDDRPEYASIQRFPRAQALIPQDPGIGLRSMDPRSLRSFSHVLLLGYSYHGDLAALEVLIERFPGNIGVIGSRTKWNTMRGILQAKGSPEHRLDQIICPLGLSIGATSVPEIALSIISQIVAGDRLGEGAAILAASASAWEADRRQLRAVSSYGVGAKDSATSPHILPEDIAEGSPSMEQP